MCVFSCLDSKSYWIWISTAQMHRWANLRDKDEDLEWESWQCCQRMLEANLIVYSTRILPRYMNGINVRGPIASQGAQIFLDGWALPARSGNGDFVHITWTLLHSQDRKVRLGIILSKEWRYDIHGNSSFSHGGKGWPEENRVTPDTSPEGFPVALIVIYLCGHCAGYPWAISVMSS